MLSDPSRPDSVPQPGLDLKPTDEDVVRALCEIEKASSAPPPIDSPMVVLANRPNPSSPPWLRAVAVFACIVLGLIFAQQWLGFSGRIKPAEMAGTPRSTETQVEAEQLLQKLAAGNSEAAGEVLEQSASWTGRTQRSAKADQSILTILNLSDLHAREAALAAELALDGVPRSDAGFSMLKEALGDPSQRVWALWMLGALGNRGIDPVHVAKILESYLADPDANVRASAVNGLALLATDETVQPLLDRFRNDPSPIVEERAACGLAQSGLYTHEQRMSAAATQVAWLDDSLLTQQQRAWSFQALRDISRQDHGTDSAAWRAWYESTP